MKKYLCLFLSLVLCLTCLSVTVFASDSRPLTEEDYYTGSTEKVGPVEIRLGTESYWIGPAHHGNPLITQSGTSGEGSSLWTAVGLWTKSEANGLISYSPVPKAAELAERYITNLSLTIKALPGTESAYPAVTDAPQNGILGTNFALSSNHNAGDWVVLVTGQADGQAFTAIGHIGVWPPAQNITHQATSVQDANDWLMKQVDVPSYTYIVFLPVGELTGTISVPDHLGMVSIRGQLRDNKPATTLIGGIFCNAYKQCMIYDLNLRGAGKNQTFWADGTPNYGIYGPSRAWMGRLHFSGYDRAVSWEDGGIKFGNMNSTFVDNRVAVHVNCNTTTGGNLDMIRCNFLNNDIALELNKLPPTIPLNFYRVLECSFINNKLDVHNRIGRLFFMPGNYFSHAILHDETAAAAAVVEGDVSIFPMAVDDTFTSFNYGETAPVVSNEKAMDFLIPAEHLDGKTISIVSQSTEKDVLLATVVLQTTEFQTALALFSEASFNATVSRTDHADSIDLSIQPIPDGYTGTLTIPCPESWVDAVVLAGEQRLDAVFANHAVSFDVPAGITEFSIRCVAKATVTDGHIQYSVHDTGNRAYWVVAAQYDGNGQLKKLATSVLEQGSFSFTHTKGAYYKLFLLSPTDYSPLCAAKKFF